MTTLLAIDTSAALCSLAIHVAGGWFEHTHKVERLHNQVVLRDLDALAARAGVSRRGFGAVAFGAGPGSFTGVRIAAAVAQGVAFASDAEVVPVRSSLALATVAFARLPSSVRRVLTVTRSRRDAYYLAGYQRDEAGVLRSRSDERLHQGDVAPAELDEEWTGAGQRPPWWPEHLPFIGGADDGIAVTARVIGALALEALARGEGLAPSAAIPFYVAGDSPWKPAAEGVDGRSVPSKR